MSNEILIREAQAQDIEKVIELDEVTSQEEKSAYWTWICGRYMEEENNNRIFLVAELRQQVVGFIVGEVRAWEFGSAPCGWVFALAVSPQERGLGIGEQLFKEICNRLKRAGVTTVRTMVDRENKLTLSFFRSQGLRTGRYIELERELE